MMDIKKWKHSKTEHFVDRFSFQMVGLELQARLFKTDQNGSHFEQNVWFSKGYFSNDRAKV